MIDPGTLVLPWPPSVNTIWRHVVIGGKPRVLLSKAGREYFAEVKRLLWPRKPIPSQVAIQIIAFPPDRRKRDIDNVLKVLLDALVKANVLTDDSQVRSLAITRDAPSKPGRVYVSIVPWGEA